MGLSSNKRTHHPTSPGQTVASTSKLGQRYHVIIDENGNVEAVYNRTTGELITSATVTQSGIITFADGQIGLYHPVKTETIRDRQSSGNRRRTLEKTSLRPIHSDLCRSGQWTKHGLHSHSPTEPCSRAPTQQGHRYRIVTSVQDNQTIVIDTRTGLPLDGATIMENGLIRLEDGNLVAPASTDKSQYLVVENIEPDGPVMIFDRKSGKQLTDATFDADGVIHLPDGSIGCCTNFRQTIDTSSSQIRTPRIHRIRPT
ncbi:hypothetical protein FGIG_02707 [Fasciola gigantica]|uniref:Uncharacterized protein n=1 Tax=Fasciola gigantica TaxID=46835 RepID=A0A504YMX0_FASGI|nr:hypothetical protein FGIG_02707 [Fasciola gigantica]